MRRWFHNVPLLQFAGALIALAFALASPLTAPGAAPDDTLFSRMYLGIAAIFIIGGVAENLTRRMLARAVFLPEIIRLADDAGFRGAPPRPLSFDAVQLALVAALLLLGGEFTILGQYQDRIGPWSWRAPIALALSEAIYLTRQFQGLALKKELELIARRWDRVKRLDRSRPRIQAFGAKPGFPTPSFPALPRRLVLGEAWSEHIRGLFSFLSHHGFDVRRAAASPGAAIVPATETREG